MLGLNGMYAKYTPSSPNCVHAKICSSKIKNDRGTDDPNLKSRLLAGLA